VDLLELQKAITKFNKETLPKIEALIDSDLKGLTDEAHALLDRIDGAKIVVNVTIDIPPRGNTGG
jgi:hypothetical protein